MKINSRAKGKRGEREVCKLLHKYWNTVEECEFVSTPLSGGFGNASVRGSFKIAGDVMTTALVFPWTVEVKMREKWDMERLKKGFKSPVFKWWLQACKAAKEENKIPFLIFRKNREPWYVMVPENCMILYQLSEFHKWKKFGKGVTVGEEWPVMFPASVLFEEVDALSISDGVKRRK